MNLMAVYTSLTLGLALAVVVNAIYYDWFRERHKPRTESVPKILDVADYFKITDRIIPFVAVNVINRLAAPFANEAVGDKLVDHERDDSFTMLNVKSAVAISVQAKLADTFSDEVPYFTRFTNLVVCVFGVLLPFHKFSKTQLHPNVKVFI